MRKSKFSENQIIAILKAVEAGRTVKDVCRKHGKSVKSVKRLITSGSRSTADREGFGPGGLYRYDCWTTSMPVRRTLSPVGPRR